MSKSLAERIGKNTRQVMKAKKEEFKAFVLKTLRERVEYLGKYGLELFENPDKRELSINPEIFNPLEWNDVKKVLRKFGFKIHNYPMRDYLAIPEENVSKEIQELLEMYDKAHMSFINDQIGLAKITCEAIFRKLEENEYEVEDIDKVSVNYTPLTCGQEFDTRVNEIMKENRFEVITNAENKWLLRILKKSD